MKKASFYIFAICALLMSAPTLTSCTDYLDKDPEADISAEEAFKDWRNFQGFVEEMFNVVPNFATGYWTNSWNWGEDEIMNVGIDYHMVYKIDQGDFWGWQSEYDGWNSGWFDRNAFEPTKQDRFQRSLWQAAWYSIRKANMGLENMDRMTVATKEERDMIMGQLYFFRGWYHFTLMQYFGDFPYIGRTLPVNEQFSEVRMPYAQIADSVARDFRKAADLLPVNWDNTAVGRQTLGKNQLRVTKITALAYLGKNYLWAGSPLFNKLSTGNSSYDTSRCQQAAEAFGELLALVDGGGTQYGLIPEEEREQNFLTFGQNGKMPGQTKDNSITEAIFRSPTYGGGWGATAWGLAKQFTPGPDAVRDGGVFSLPTANYVNYYGMANGLPLDDPNSGFDPSHPWKDRDPRFYTDITYDGLKIVAGSINPESDRYANLYTGGSYRDVNQGSRTGYMLRKFIDISCNKPDDGWGWSPQIHINVPWMRLADVYLMYAEAAAEAYGNPNGKSNNCPLSALEAVNKIRERAGVPDFDAKYTGSVDAFMSELRRERAVELAYEGHRFNDLRRWLLLDKAPYNKKTSQEFIRVEHDAKNPENSSVSGWSEKTILTRDFTEKHYWFPLKRKDCNMYPEFKQNPGW